MPKYRQLHVKIIDSFDFNEMPDDFCRVTWMLLPIIVDREGRGIFSMAWLRSKIYPMREDVTTGALQAAFDWYINRGMIVTYQVENKSYFYIPTFRTYQSGTNKEAASVLPAPPDLLQSKSGVTPELVRVNTMQIQYNAESSDKTPPLFSDNEAEQLYRAVTHHMSTPSGERQSIYDALRCIISQQGENAVDYLRPFWTACHERYPGTVKAFWLTDWAATGIIPNGKKPDEKPDLKGYTYA
jgi:hypothetical protein